ncbi:MAG TPA: hypothetical protein VFB12_25655 [Ktedonobacteraceae bacterium]|nr:hypothetical protein [Ktedonobacteraceae bacterium]
MHKIVLGATVRSRAGYFALLLILLALIVTVFYYLNYPGVELNADTPAYLHVVERIQTHAYQLADTWRLPGYPLLILLVYALSGQGNLMAVSIVQAGLFVLATLEIYVLALWLAGRAWLAFLIGLLVGSNIILLSYVKPIMSEGVALWLLTTLALAIAYFVRTTSVRAFWLVVICILPLFLTRPEWTYLPLPLFAYLLLVALRRGMAQRLWRHGLIALGLIYVVVGGYVAGNALMNHYAGITAIENINLFGKVLQYNMQDEAGPEYAATVRRIDVYRSRGDWDPYHILPHVPELAQDNAAPAAQFARSIIVQHPLEFLVKSVPPFFSSLIDYSDVDRQNIPGPFDGPLNALKSVDRVLYLWNATFPLWAVVWLFMLCWRRTRSNVIVLTMGAMVLLVLYGLIVTTLGGYSSHDYMRVHIVFDPLLILVTWHPKIR